MDTDALFANEPVIRLGCFFVVLVGMVVWEFAAPRRTLLLSRVRRWPSNLGVVAINALLLRLIFPAAAVGAAFLAEQRGWGLLHVLGLPDWTQIVVTVVLLDFAIYLQHVLAHAVPVFWRLHRMHHADLDFDVTTGVRFHPIEIVLSMTLKLGVVLAMGAAPIGVLLFEVLLNATSMFNHGNVRMTKKLDRFLRWLVVTPDMHRVHHSINPHETNSNFGFNLPWWDRLLGTYRAQPEAGHEKMAIGLDVFRDPEELRLGRMLIQPFIGSAGRYPINRRSDVP
jgi:sterol desaturase/sphingolipid hydroxylase (fatty acid hydroxylase superfamily)